MTKLKTSSSSCGPVERRLEFTKGNYTKFDLVE